MFVLSMFRDNMCQHGNFENSLIKLKYTTVCCNSFKNSKTVVTVSNYMKFVKIDDSQHGRLQ